MVDDDARKATSSGDSEPDVHASTVIGQGPSASVAATLLARRALGTTSSTSGSRSAMLLRGIAFA